MEHLLKKYFKKCIRCESRRPACQSHCEYYTAQREQYQAEKEALYKAKLSNSVYMGYKGEQKDKVLHHKVMHNKHTKIKK